MTKIMNYGLPYKGSKSRIARWVTEVLPPGERLYDLFAGGCAVTHAAMLSGRWQHFHANDITDAPVLFANAVRGKYHGERRWIGRDDFFRLKDTDPYVRYCWSFGNNGRDYMYAREIEPYKRACWDAVVWDDMRKFIHLCPEVADAVVNALLDYPLSDGGITPPPRDLLKQRRIVLGRAVVAELKRIGDMRVVEDNPLYKSCHWKNWKNARSLQSLQSLERLQSLESLESLERLERLQRLQRLESLEVTIADYQDVEIEPRSTVYCDIPYRGTGGYNGECFDHDRFYEWADSRDYPVFVSEYAMPPEFAPIARREKRVSISATATNIAAEHIFVQKRYADRYKRDLFL